MKKLLTLLMFFSVSIWSKAESYLERQDNFQDSVILEGRVTDTLGRLGNNEKFTVNISISVFSASYLTAPQKKYVALVDSNNYFKFVIQSPADRFYAHISYTPKGDTFFDNIYILESGDHILCELAKDNYKFSGKGAVKMSCQNDIYRVRYKPLPAKLENLSIEQWSKNIDTDAVKYDSVLNVRLKILKNYEKNLGKELAEIMEANCYGLRYLSWLRAIRNYLPSGNRFLGFVNSDSYKNINRSLEKKVSTASLIASPNYLEFVFELLLVENLKRPVNRGGNSGNMEWVYERIKSDFKGIILEKLMTIYFLRYNRNPLVRNKISEALIFVENHDYRRLISEIENSKSRGEEFYPFELEDDSGKIVKLTDFRDKILLVDFWFTGCGPCKILNQAMVPVINFFSNNSKVKFISINVDSDKSRWLESVASGEYTHNTSINLFIGKKGETSYNGYSMIDRYNIVQFPTLILLKNGKIHTYGPPKPLPEDKNNLYKGNTKLLIDLIISSLNYR